MTQKDDYPDEIWVIKCKDETGEDYFDACPCEHPKSHGYERYTRSDLPQPQIDVETVARFLGMYPKATKADIEKFVMREGPIARNLWHIIDKFLLRPQASSKAGRLPYCTVCGEFREHGHECKAASIEGEE